MFLIYINIDYLCVKRNPLVPFMNQYFFCSLAPPKNKTRKIAHEMAPSACETVFWWCQWAKLFLSALVSLIFSMRSLIGHLFLLHSLVCSLIWMDIPNVKIAILFYLSGRQCQLAKNHQCLPAINLNPVTCDSFSTFCEEMLLNPQFSR